MATTRAHARSTNPLPMRNEGETEEQFLQRVLEEAEDMGRKSVVEDGEFGSSVAQNELGEQAKLAVRFTSLETLVGRLVVSLEANQRNGASITPVDNNGNNNNNGNNGNNIGNIGINSHHGNRNGTATDPNVLKALWNGVPKYDGKGGAQPFYEFIGKMERYLGAANLSEDSQLLLALSKLTDSADLAWRSHETAYSSNSLKRVKSWDQLKTLLKSLFVPQEQTQMVLTRLKNIEQKGRPIILYNDEFNSLRMQVLIADKDVELNYYLCGLDKPIRKVIESNPANLANLETLQQAALRQDQIDNPDQTAKKTVTTALAANSNDRKSNKNADRNGNSGKSGSGNGCGHGNGCSHGNGQGSQGSGGSSQESEWLCFACKEKGHKAEDCPVVLAGKRAIAAEKKAKESAAGAAAHQAQGREGSHVAMAWMARTMAFDVTKAPVTQQRKVVHVIDTGTSTHMTPNKGHIRDAKSDSTTVYLANEDCIFSHAKGEMDISFPVHGNRKSAILKNTLYVPKLARPLLSVAAVNDNGIDVSFKQSGVVEFVKSGEILALGRREGNLFVLEGELDGIPDNVMGGWNNGGKSAIGNEMKIQFGSHWVNIAVDDVASGGVGIGG